MRAPVLKTGLMLFCIQMVLWLGSCSSQNQTDKNQALKEEISVKDATREKIISMVRPQLEAAGFKYQSEKHDFVRRKNDFEDEILVQANNKADFYFHFGRLFPAVEEMVAPFESKKYLNTPDLTVWDSSMNAGPNFPEHYKIEGAWTYSPETEKKVAAEVQDFINEFMLPWLDKFPDLKSARAKLMRRPMAKAETTMQILAIDVLLKDKKEFHNELARSIPALENSTTHDAAERVQKFTDTIYKQHPEFKKK